MATQLAQVETRNPARKGRLRAAALTLRWQCRAGQFDEDPDCFVDAMGTLAELAPQLWDHELASAATAVCRSPSEVSALHQLGRTLVDRRLFDLAVTVLSRANRLQPGGAGLLCELACALEADGRSDRAVEVLLARSDALNSSFLCRHLLAHNAVMAGQFQAARGFAQSQLPTSESEAAMASRVLEMTERADAMLDGSPLDGDDLRGWHFVTTGGVLLHLSPYGQESGMHGRYGVFADSYVSIRYCLQRLRWSLSAFGLHPTRVMSTDDVASLGLAAAVARLLALPLARLDAAPGLIVVYDTSSLSEDATEALSSRLPGQVLYAHATCWTEPSITPELTGILYESISPPWSQDPTHPPSEPPTSRRTPNNAVAGPLTDRMLHANPKAQRVAPADTDQALLRFLSAARDLVGTRGMGDRLRMPAGGGPVNAPRAA